MTQVSSVTNSIDLVLECVTYFGAAILPIWGIDQNNKCLCPKKDKCESPGKHPNGKLVPQGVHDASRNFSIIREWYSKAPRSNWALRTGDPMPGGGFLAILDEDPRNGSEESIVQFPDLPETVTQTSGSGGRHRLYRFPISPSARTLGPGLDLQGASKYCVIAPSRHASGGQYHWNLGEGPGEIDVPAAPDWLVEGTSPAAPRPEQDTADTARETVLGELFTLAGRAGALMPNGNLLVNCPNSDNHSDARGKGTDASCVILPPAGGSRFGAFSCKHSGCATLKWNEVLSMMPPEMVKAAQKKYPIKLVAVSPNMTETHAPPRVWAPTNDWEEELKVMMAWKTTKTGHKPVPDIVNCISILTYDPRWKDVLKFDEFSQVLRFTKPPQWHPDDAGKDQSDVWTDNDTTRLDAWMRRNWALELPNEKLREAVYVVGMRDSYNPLRDWLNQLEWDGTKRAETWLSRYLGADDTPYTRAAGKKWLISAVARGMKPGVKVDSLIVLEGGQGVGKSTALKTLAGGEKMFSDSPVDLGSKDAFVSLRGRWFIELAELSSLSRADNEKAKAFFSSATDSYRPPYGRELVQVPRTVVFAGTTNLGQYLNDETGGRRYWPVKVGVIDIRSLEQDREQIWAEIVHAFKNGETWWPSYQETPLFESEQLAREVSDAWHEDIHRWVSSPQGVELLKQHSYLTLIQIAHYALAITPKDANHTTAIRISRVMNQLGFKKDRATMGPGRVTVFRK